MIAPGQEQTVTLPDNHDQLRGPRVRVDELDAEARTSWSTRGKRPRLHPPLEPAGPGGRGELQFWGPRPIHHRGQRRLAAVLAGDPRHSGERFEMVTSEGSLVRRDLAEIVHGLYLERWAGVLILSNGGIGKNVTFQEGRMVFASSSSLDERLGELLLRRGRIGLRQYADAGAAIAPGKRLGQVLVEQGVLTPKDLVKAVGEQTRPHRRL